MPALPAKGNLDGTAVNQTGVFQAAIGDFREFVAFLLGTSGIKADAQKTLGVAVVDRAYSEQVGYSSLSPLLSPTAVPQITQGTQIHAASITPKSVTNRVRARLQCPFSSASTNRDFGVAGLFVNGATSASAAITVAVSIDSDLNVLVLEYEWVPGVLTAQAVTIRVGCGTGAFQLNGNRFGAVVGGISRSTLVLEEITA